MKVRVRFLGAILLALATARIVTQTLAIPDAGR
jgi:hypothetical protein